MKTSHITALAALAISSTAAFGQVELLSAEQITDVESSFTLDFGELGGKTIAGVSDTEFEIQIDKRGKFARFLNYAQNVGSIKLPGGLETGKAEADYTDGVLTLTFPKAEEVKPKSIKIQTK